MSLNSATSKGRVTAILTIALSLGLTMGVSTASYALSFSDQFEPPWQDDPRQNGRRDLGKNISDVSATPLGVYTYLESLSPQARRGIIGGCWTALANPVQVQAEEVVFPFCALAVTVYPSSTATIVTGEGG